MSNVYLDYLEHYGVKGMKWGIRKKPVYSTLGPNRYDVTTSSGKKLSIQKDPQVAVARFLSLHGSDAAKRFVNSTASYTIRDDSNKKVGTASVAKTGNNELHLDWLKIDSSQQGRGYGTAVLNGAVAIGKASGFSKAVLEVPGISPDARHIYEKAGFKVVKIETSGDIWGGLTRMELDY